MIGQRILRLQGPVSVYCPRDNLKGFLVFGEERGQGEDSISGGVYHSGLISTDSQETFIKQIKTSKISKETPLAKISGLWTKEIFIDQKLAWSKEDNCYKY